MKILDRKLLRDIVRNAGMLSAVVAIIAVGTGSFVGMLGAYNNLDTARRSYYSECRMADFWIDLKKAPVTEVERLTSLPGVSEIRERICFPVVIDLEGVNKPISGQVVSMPAIREPVINGIVMRQGSYFTAERRNEVICTEKFAKARDIKPGDFIHLVLNGQKKELFVVGTAISAEHIYSAPPGGIVDDPMQYGILYIKRGYAEDCFGFHGACNNIVGLLTPGARAHPHAVLDILDRRLSRYGVFAATPLKQQFSNLMLSSELGGLQTMATMLPVMFLSVAALVLNVLMTRMAEQQRTIVGTFKALGYGNKAIFGHFLKYGFVVGIAGGVLGCALGYWLSAGMNIMYDTVFTFPDLRNDVYSNVMSSAVLISVFFAALGSLRGVKSVAALNPAEAMRMPAPPSCGGIILERWAWFWKRMDFRWQIVLRGLFRNKGRSIISILAASMGSALMILAFGLVDSTNAMMDFQFAKVLVCDYQLSFKDEVDGGALYEAQRLPGVTLAEPILKVPCTFENGNSSKKGVITGLIPDATLTIPRDKQGNAVKVPPSGVLMTKRLADDLGLVQGDTVTFIPVKGEKRPYVVKVVRTIDSMIGLGVYADYGYLNRLIGESSAISEIQMKARQNPEQKRDFYSQLKRCPALQSVDEIQSQKANMKKQFTGAMQSTAFVMIVFAGVIFFGSILNGSLIAIAERQREIATFRVLGYRPREIGTVFFRENMCVNMIGAFLGLPIGYWMLKGMMTQFKNDAYAFPCSVADITWVYTIVLAFVFVVGAHMIIQRCIEKINWPEALSMKE